MCNAQYGKLLPDYALPADLKTTYGKALSDITLPTGWKCSDPSIVPTVTNNGYEAYYAIENDADYDWTNENGYNAAAKQIKLTLTVTVEKEKQKLSFEKSSINKYTTDSAFTNELTKTAVFGAVSFSSRPLIHFSFRPQQAGPPILRWGKHFFRCVAAMLKNS